MNDKKSRLSEKSASTYSRESQLDFSFFQPVWWNMKLWQDVVGKLKESRERKKEKMVWNRLMKKKRLYMNTVGGSITK